MDGTAKPLLAERAASRLLSGIRENAVPLASSLIAGFLAYAFFFTNKLLNHDEAYCLFSKGATVESGRWGLGGIDLIFPNISMPWIYGVLAILLIAAAVCFIVRLFNIRSKLFQALLAGCILVFPSLTGTLSYIFTASSFALSFLLAVVAVWLLQRPSALWGIPAAACMVASLSIYQSYISVAAGLLVLVLIRRLLREEDVRSVIRQGIYFLLFLIVSLGLYYLSVQVVLRIKHVSLGSYAGNNVSFRLSAIPAGIAQAYASFFAFFSSGKAGLMPTAFSRWMHALGIAAACVLLVLWSIRNRQPGRLLLLAALTSILPLAVNCMYLFTVPDAIHTLVLYGFISVYVLIVIAADACLPLVNPGRIREALRRLGLNIIALSLACIIVSNIYVANAASLHLLLRQENTRAFYTALVADLQQMPEFAKAPVLPSSAVIRTQNLTKNLPSFSSLPAPPASIPTTIPGRNFWNTIWAFPWTLLRMKKRQRFGLPPNLQPCPPIHTTAPSKNWETAWS